MEKSHISIKNWSDDDKPREKLVLKGKQSLSNAELMAILLGSGSRDESALELSKKILNKFENSLHQLGKANLKQLTSFKGMGVAKAVTIISALELGRRRKEEEPKEIKKITSSKDVFTVMQPFIGDLQHEEFWLLLLDNANKVIATKQLSRGGITATIVDCRIIFKMALEANAVSIILCHNHPSGKTTPSEADITVTKKVVTMGKTLEIPILDHIIITETSYYSFADEGNI